MVIFDATLPGTTVADWDADPRMHDRRSLRLDGVDALVVVAAHPDDETLGAAGLIAEAVHRGIPATMVVVTDGGASAGPGIVERRAAEASAAARSLGAGLVLLEMPDGGILERRDEVRAALEPILAATSHRTLIAAPWRGDGHRDHRVVGEVVAELVGARRFLEYPIWMWHWADPDHEDVPWSGMVALSIDPERKARAIAHYPSQTSGREPMLRPDFLEQFSRPVEYFIETRATLGREYFDGLYERRDDPWGFESRWYEERKRALTMAILPQEQYGSVFEVGCSIGVLTQELAARTSDLLAVDISEAAVSATRLRVGGAVRVQQLDEIGRAHV